MRGESHGRVVASYWECSEKTDTGRAPMGMREPTVRRLNECTAASDGLSYRYVPAIGQIPLHIRSITR